MFFKRRTFFALIALGFGAALAACSPQASGAPSKSDMALGPATAKVTVIEYASLACPFCKKFHDEVYPKIKDNYIDSGKIRFIFREFPVGSQQEQELGTAGALVARCIGTTADKYFKAVDTFYEQQPAIFAAAEQPNGAREKFMEIAKAGGISEDAFSKCLSDPAALAQLNKQAEDGVNKFKVGSTPTIIINGTSLENSPSNPYTYERVAAAIDAELKK